MPVDTVNVVTRYISMHGNRIHLYQPTHRVRRPSLMERGGEKRLLLKRPDPKPIETKVVAVY